jgi:hypothetical protein
MALATLTVRQTYTDVAAATPISVPIPLFETGDIIVYYGNEGAVAVENTDYTITLNETDYSDFTLTPTASLIAKIDALIAADETEANTVTVYRSVTLDTEITPSAARNTDVLSREFDRTMMKLQQLDEALGRAPKLSPNYGGSPLVIELSATPTEKLVKIDANGKLVDGPAVSELEAQASAVAAAEAAQTAAESAQTAAESAQTGAEAAETAAAESAGEAAAAAASLDVTEFRPYKDSVRVATTENITLANLQTVDGVSLAAGDRVLVKDQTAPEENGIYVVVDGGAWTRTDRAAAWAQLVSAVVPVEEGTVNADTVWLCKANAGGTLDTTAVEWERLLDAADIGVAVQGYDPATVKGDTTQNLTVGYTFTSDNIGNTGATTVTPAFTAAPLKRCTVTGNFKIEAPASGEGNYIMQVTNDGTGGYTFDATDFDDVKGTYDDTASAVQYAGVFVINGRNVLIWFAGD